MIVLAATVSHSFSQRIFNINQNQAWSYHIVTLHSACSLWKEPEHVAVGNLFLWYSLCFSDWYNKVNKKENLLKTNFREWLQFCQNNEQIGLEERYMWFFFYHRWPNFWTLKMKCILWMHMMNQTPVLKALKNNLCTLRAVILSILNLLYKIHRLLYKKCFCYANSFFASQFCCA